VSWQHRAEAKIGQALCISNRLAAAVGIPHEAVSGCGWLAVSKVVARGGTFLQMAVLARFLAPADFGCVAVAMFILGVVEAFTEPGLNTALTQRKGAVHDYLDSVLTFAIGRGFLLAGLVYWVAPWSAAYWHVPESASLFRALALLLVIRALSNPGLVLLTRDLDFKRLCAVDIAHSLSSFVLAVLVLAVRRDAWVLVVPLLGSEAARVAASYRVLPYSPRLRIEWSRLRDLIQFGRWVLLSRITVFIGGQGDRAIVGRALGPRPLGLYQLAGAVAGLARLTVGETLAYLAFPLLSQCQDDGPNLRRPYLSLFRIVFVSQAVYCVALVIFARPVVTYVLGSQWIAAIPALQILAVVYLLRGLSALPAYLLYSTGHPRAHFLASAISVFVLCGSLWPLSVAYGFTGSAVANLASACATLAVVIFFVQRQGLVDWLDHVAILRKQSRSRITSQTSVP
jgi:PST family polysaccharide transporter/lipopolysaccharide exporter